MIKRRNKLLGASAILIGLWAPFTVQAHDNDDTWLQLAGAVATYVHFNNHAYNHYDHYYAEKHWRKHQRQARRHHDRSHRHQRYMHRGYDQRNLANHRINSYDRRAQRHHDRTDRRRSRHRHS